MVSIKEIESYLDYGKCLSISNGEIEAYVTLDLGPRIIRFGFVGGQNFMCDARKEFGELTDKKYTDFFGEGRKWESMGGHRVWLSPESYPETYTPDDKPVTYKATENGAIFTYAEDTEIGAQKTLEIIMDQDDTNMKVKMDIKNISDKPMEFSVWALSVCNKNGTLIVPMNTNDTGLLSNRIISVWPYTDMSSDRIYWGNKYVTIRQDVNAQSPIKLGFDLNCGTVYYVIDDEVFCKRYETNHPKGKYPDGGCSFETYTDKTMIEVEALSELKTVKSGESNTLEEIWSLFKKPCDIDFKNDNSIDNFFNKI